MPESVTIISQKTEAADSRIKGAHYKYSKAAFYLYSK